MLLLIGLRTAGESGRFRARRRAELNYRHHFHAGNFADIVKHSLLLVLLRRLTAQAGPLAVVDTHAGAGLYDLRSTQARRSAEAEAGVLQLMQASDPPAALEALRREVRALNRNADVRVYPGSPVLALRTLRPGDSYLGCELRDDDHATLARTLREHAPPGVAATAHLADGFEAALEIGGSTRQLVLIDPPFERGDDYERSVATVGAAAGEGRTFAIWTPLKDLETFDAFLGAMEALNLRGCRGLAAEARLHPLDNPLRMNGCAVVVVGPTAVVDTLAEPAQAVCEWVCQRLGGSGAKARIGMLDIGN